MFQRTTFGNSSTHVVCIRKKRDCVSHEYKENEGHTETKKKNPENERL